MINSYHWMVFSDKCMQKESSCTEFIDSMAVASSWAATEGKEEQ